MTQTTVAKDSRQKPMPPPKGASMAENQGVSWVAGWRWNPTTNVGYFTLGKDAYRISRVAGDEQRPGHCSTWHVAKVVGEDLAIPYVVTTPIPGSSFPASCTCRGFEFSKQSPRSCRHTSATTAALECLEVHEPADDLIDRMELTERVAKCG